TKRENLHLLFVLIDSRHEPQNIDLNFFRFLGEEGIPFSIIFTKTDKLSATQLSKNLEIYSQQLLPEWEELPKMFITSSETGVGHDEVLDYIENCLKSK
ncbi:MAG: YihA family ribosome biogenesis GTP-binding protein, partial [Rikenellaceae bacterium]